MQVERARQEVEDTRGAPIGRVVVGVPYSVGRLITAPLATRFKQAFPQATLSMTEGLTVHLYEWLLSGRIDVALLHDPVPTPELEIIRSEEHTSELQSLMRISYAVFCLQKKNKQ